MPVLPPAPACPTVTTRGCGCTSAPPAGAGQHSRGHWHCSTHLTFLASQLSPPLYFTCSFFPAALCLFIIFPCHTGLLQAFSQWRSLGLLLLWWDSPAAAIPGGGNTPAGVRCSSAQERVVLCGVAAASGVQTAEERISILLRGCLVWGARLVTEV